MKLAVVKCRMCKGLFEQSKTLHHRICPQCRTPEKMAAAGYGVDDIWVETNVSYKRARDAVFGPAVNILRAQSPSFRVGSSETRK